MHFQAEYAELIRWLLPVPASRVLLATVPHVTVAPIAAGVNPANPGKKWREGSRYFPYYTDPWIPESAFRPDKQHRHITHQQARAIDSAIDQYNDTIQDHVRRARADGRDWHLVDLCGILDGVAHRRYLADPPYTPHSTPGRPLPAPAPFPALIGAAAHYAAIPAGSDRSRPTPDPVCRLLRSETDQTDLPRTQCGMCGRLAHQGLASGVLR